MTTETATKVGSVSSLWRYPIKSMMGEELTSAEITERGILGDRAYALVDRETGKVVSAKNPRKWAKMFRCSAEFVEPPKQGSDMPPVRVALPGGEITVSSDADFDSRLSKALGRDVTLTATSPQQPFYDHFWFDYQTPLGRPVESPEGESITTVPLGFAAPGTFFDYSALHLLTLDTLKRLQELYPGGRWESRRFRPNIVVESEAGGDGGFIEDAWIGHGLNIGTTVSLKVFDTMVRCVMTTIPQGDLPNDPGILRTVADNHRVLMPALGKELPAVGVAVSVAAGGRVSRGDEVILQQA